jgi:RNA polymerase sigma factor (sigma-70 family)
MMVGLRADSDEDRPSSVQEGGVNATSDSRPQPPAGDERLESVVAFQRFLKRLTPRVMQWVWSVPTADREDVVQEFFLLTHRRRESYDPRRGTWVEWSYPFAIGVLRNYLKAMRRRTARVDVARAEIPDVAVDRPSPEDEVEGESMRRLLARCLETLDPESTSILIARAVDGLSMEKIAAAHEIPLGRANRIYQATRERLQAMLDDDGDRKRQRGCAVLPISVDQVLAADGAPDSGSSTAQRVWQRLGPRIAKDAAPGTLRDDGTDVTPFARLPPIAPGAQRAARALRALLGPRGLPALTYVLGAATAALVTYEIMKDGGEARRDTTAEARLLGPIASRPVVLSPGPAPTAGPEPSEPPRSGSSAAGELRADAGTSERPEAGSDASADGLGATSEALFDQGSDAFQQGRYAAAIRAFRRHASKYPQGPHAETRDKLLALAIIRAERQAASERAW